jgi:hypothetical protein
MDLMFHAVADRPGSAPPGVAVVSRATGEEMPIVRECSFDGVRLRLQLASRLGRPPADRPLLEMSWTGERFEGGWTMAGAPVGPPLKLVRAE